MPNLDLIFTSDNRTEAIRRHEKGLLICLAGPGTGKTYSLLKRSEVLNSKGVHPHEICYLTFIKEIADSFLEDYIDEFSTVQDASQRPRISTLHSFACRLIRNLGFQIGFEGELFFDNMADKHTDIAKTLLNDVMLYIHNPLCTTIPQLRTHLGLVKQAWQNTLDPNDLADPIPSILPSTLDILRAFRFVDWDQTIPIAHSLLKKANPIPEWILQISHYFVDEFQDFNKAEQAFIFLLSNLAISTVIVGDDNQSLFSSRGGSPDGIRSLYANPLHDQISLINCFRCREIIVQAANLFLSSMRPDFNPMIPMNKGGSIISYKFKSTIAEFAFLTNLLKSQIAEMPNPPNPKDGTVCLFTSWKQLNYYFDNLSPSIPYIKRQYQPSPDRLWLERVLLLLRHPNQRFIQRLLINRLKDVKPRHINIIVNNVVERDCDIPTAIDLLLTDGKLKGAAASQFKLFSDFLRNISSKKLDLIAGYLASSLGLEQAHVTASLDLYIQKIDSPETENLISMSADIIYPQSAQPQEDPKAILFLTMHGSKGLTRKNVVLPGLEAAWLPGEINSINIDEKKRLFYVAITRATDSVTITYPLHRLKNDPLNYETPGRGKASPFIKTAGITEKYHE
jgi:DNA helicase-2/ATP-dependent DNA helicase PcrA